MRRLIVRGAGLRGPTGAQGMTGSQGPRGLTGSTGPRGLPGINAVPADEAVAGYVEAPDSATGQALAATLVTQIETEGNALRDAILALIAGYVPPGPAVPTLAESGPGYSIKANSLDRFRTSKADPNTLTEVVVFGDSTTQGSGDEGGPDGSGYIPELRRRAIASGLSDGGLGIARAGMTAAESGENLAPVFASTVTTGTGGNQFDIFNGNTPHFSTIGQSRTYQGKGTRLRLYYTSSADYAQFTYKVDNAAAVTVNPATILAGTSRIGVVEVNGLADTLHKVVVTNLGKSVAAVPIFFQELILGGPDSANGFSSGTYYYCVTLVTTAGEGTPNVAKSIMVPNGPRNIAMNLQRAHEPEVVTAYRFYRSTTGNPGSFQRVGQVANNNDNFIQFVDDNTATPGAAAPTTDTSGLATSTNGTVAVDVEWTRDTGIVFHNQGVSGSDYGSYFTPDNNNLNTAAQAALGRVQGGTASTDDAQPAASSPPWRKPVLATCALGINNQTGTSSSTAVITAGATKFAKFCVNGGIDGILIVPHFEHSTGDPQAAANKAAIISVADAYGLSWVAFDQALNAGSYAGPDQHLDHDGYVLEGTFLWDKVLSK